MSALLKSGDSQPDIFCHFREKYRNTYKIKCHDKGLKTADSSTKPVDKPEDPASATDKGTSEAPQNPETPAVNVNGQPVVTVTPTAPVITAAGQTIVSTQNSQIVIANTDGTTSVVAPEAVGFKVNADGTLTGKDAKGKEVTLPKTGEASTVILTMVGTFFLAAAAFLGLKKRA